MEITDMAFHVGELINFDIWKIQKSWLLIDKNANFAIFIDL